MNRHQSYLRSHDGSNGQDRQSGRYFDIRDMGDQGPPTNKIDCMKCKHYYVTWEPAFPRGCRLFQFKGKQMPCDVVRESTGFPCEQFEKRKPRT